MRCPRDQEWMFCYEKGHGTIKFMCGMCGFTQTIKGDHITTHDVDEHAKLARRFNLREREKRISPA